MAATNPMAYIFILESIENKKTFKLGTRSIVYRCEESYYAE